MELYQKVELKVEVNLVLQKILKPISIPNKKSRKKKAFVMKDKNQESEKVEKKIHCVVRILVF
jgi:hypothetical protein